MLFIYNIKIVVYNIKTTFFYQHIYNLLKGYISFIKVIAIIWMGNGR